MGYDSLHDLIENERAEKHCGMNVKDAMDDFDVSLVCKRFPSIILGSSSPVELYDGTASFFEKMALLTTQSPGGFPSDSTGEEQEQDYLYETGDSLYPAFPSVESSLLRVDQSTSLATDKISYPVLVEESSRKVSHELQKDMVSDELILDSSISCIPGISKKRRSQLENCGFHTVSFQETYVKGSVPIFIENSKYALAHIFSLLFIYRCGNCCTTFLGPMLIYRMLKLKLMMDST